MAKHPILMDPKYPLTTVFVRDAHTRVKHNGVRETLTELRSRYWIVHGRSFVRRMRRMSSLNSREERISPPPRKPKATLVLVCCIVLFSSVVLLTLEMLV